MIALASYCLTALAVLLAIPSLIFVVEIAAALVLPVRPFRLRNNDRSRVAVLIPAHNESTNVLPTIKDVKTQLIAGDRLIVVADNCTDDTAAVAQKAGAEVIVRQDPLRKGKGYALEFGIAHLSENPPQTVVIIDADCRVSSKTIDHLATTCENSGRPVQALDLMTAPAGSPVNHRAAEFAWRVKNWVRPLGLSALHLPCQLMGTGMALPWALIRTTRVAGTSLVEDMKLGLDLAAAGAAPLFCTSALVTSQFPVSAEGAQTQRHRWEQGHIHLMLTALPRVLGRSLASGNLSLLALALDLTVPPLSLLILLLVAMLVISSLAALLGLAAMPLIVVAATSTAVAIAIFAAWWQFGRDVLPLRSAFLVIAYMAKKIPIYCRALSGRSTAQWIRTDREKPR